MNRAARSIVRRLLKWYDANHRKLPWRASPGLPANPYHVLVSEAMLQQTQVATVLPYFARFIERFPTLAHLAAADEQDVLRLWQGLGYYSRARNLRAAAGAVVSIHNGAIPREVDALLALPGIGRYTAGAISSIAFNQPAPILDGNVARVICRLDKIESDPRDRSTVAQMWQRATELVPTDRPGDFNQAMMELGATVCVPRTPRCLSCPLRDDCKAFAAGVQDQIPPPRKAAITPLSNRWTFCIECENRWLIEQRPATGRWARLWQFITIESPKKGKPTSQTLREKFGIAIDSITPLATIHHALTHRRYTFHAFRCKTAQQLKSNDAIKIKWVSLNELDAFPMSRPQLKIAAGLREFEPPMNADKRR